ncbi:hypothetical protein J3R83DRAFT_7620 [Lanmaoa asiatica]|nr:hypothetical protein J3R83DRAFT_7620 [Lanmaoa asiatica]
MQDIPLKLGTLKCHQSAFSLPVETPASDTFATVPDGFPYPPPFDSNSEDPEVPFGQAWDEFEAEHTVHVDDYFDVILQMIENGESIFPTMLPPLEDELGLEDFDELDLIPPHLEDHGIDVEAVRGRASQPAKSKVATYVSPNEPLYPWKSRPEFLTHLLFSFPRLRFSQAQKTAVLTWAKDLGTPEVPSMYAMKKAQECFMELLGMPTEKMMTASGNIFYLNALSKAVAMDFANPLTRFAMQEYPEDGQGCMSQVHHGTKMLDDLPDTLAPPCVHVEYGIYFVHELLQQSTGQFFIPKKFFQARMPESSEPTVLALGHRASETAEGYAVDPEMIVVKVSTFIRTFEDLQRRAGESGIHFTGLSFFSSPIQKCKVSSNGSIASSVTFSNLMPNSLRAKSGGRMVYAVPLIVFMDDVSGNVSKQWNKHHVVYVSNGLLPRQILEQEFTIRFTTGSPHATPMELMQGIKDSIQKAADNPVIAFDVKYEEEVMLIPYNLIITGDNPMQAEECSHGGLKCNYLCRTCKVGGTNAEKKSDKGYSDVFQCGELRTPEDTHAIIKNQIELSMLSGGTEKVKNALSRSGIKDSATVTIVDRLLALGKTLRKKPTGGPRLSEVVVTARLHSELDLLLGGKSLDDRINPLLSMPGINIHKDTPTEILHTILLGIVKYFWGQTAYILEKDRLVNVFQTRLASINQEGLNAPTLHADYIIRYKGALVGKHFKGLAQVMPYLIYDLVPEKVLQGWSLIGKLVVLLWHTSIEDTETYLATLSHVIDDLLTISAQCAPSILVTKAKFHFLVHLPMFIRRFGPAILFSTERYESFNGVYRLSSVYSNRQAPSRDACHLFAEQDNVKHVVSGGTWHDPTAQKWVKAGPGVTEYFDAHPHQRRLLGFPDMKSQNIGAAQLPPHVEVVCPIGWDDTEAARCGMESATLAPQRGARFYKATSFTAVQGDKTRVGTHVIIKHGKVLVPVEQCQATHVAISLLEFLPELHPQLCVPRIKYPMPEQMKVVSSLAAIPSVLYDKIYAPLISDHTVLRVHAAQILRSKKDKDQLSGANCDKLPSTEQGVFEKSQKTRKGKGKAAPTNIQPVQPRVVSSDPKPSSSVLSDHIQTSTPFIYTHPSSDQRHQPHISILYDPHPLPPHQTVQTYPTHYSAYAPPYELLPQAPYIGTSFGPHQPHALHDPRPPLLPPHQTIQPYPTLNPTYYTPPYGSLPQASVYLGTGLGQPHTTRMFPNPNHPHSSSGRQ